MRKRSVLRSVPAGFAVFLFLTAAGMESAGAASQTSVKTVVATIAQIGQPLSVIADGRIRVETLMGEGVDPHLYRLTRSDVKKLTNAHLILYNGRDLEAQLIDVMARLARHKPVIPLAEALPETSLAGDDPVRDPHVWMDPVLWMKALDTAVQALEVLDPDNSDVYRKNASAYFGRMMAADARARKRLSSLPPSHRTLVTAHDAFGHFGRAYGLEVVAVQGLSTGSEAGVRRIEELVDMLVTRRIATVFVETSVSERNIRALIEGAAARGHRVRMGGNLYSDALGPRGSPTGTWLGMFEHNINTIVRALAEPIRVTASVTRQITGSSHSR